MRSRKYTPPHHYTAAEIRFLEKKVTGRSHAELTELFNRHFGLDFSVSRLGSTLKRLGLSNGYDGRFPPGHIPFNKGLRGVHFGRETEFKPGNRPANYKPVGTERINSQGYVDVRIRNPTGKRWKNWKARHRIIWEKAHGKIPRGHIVIFADGNRLNFALDNLLLVSRKELAVMNRQGLVSAHGELTRTGKAVADLKIAIAERKQEMKKKKNHGRRGGGSA